MTWNPGAVDDVVNVSVFLVIFFVSAQSLFFGNLNKTTTEVSTDGILDWSFEEEKRLNDSRSR